ncbi:MAG: hypothetical protein KAR20_25400 [Candidatus Heimdallarchaeota archaeon]|nr:hypothetical protein [Candidatus Heimdallarchaeota archaeon]
MNSNIEKMKYKNKQDQAIVNLNLTDCSADFIAKHYYNKKVLQEAIPALFSY